MIKSWKKLQSAPYFGVFLCKKNAYRETLADFDLSGKELDAETGFCYYGARYLNPKTSMWISADPAVSDYIPKAPVDDEAKKHNGNLPGMGGVCNYVNFHVYHYAGNNPVKYMDPTGEYGEWEYEYEKINTEVQKEIRPRTNSERIAIEKNTSAGLVPLTDEQFSHFREEHIIAENLVSDKRLEVLDMLTSLGHTARRLDGVRNKEFLMGILNSLNAYKDYISGSGEGAASALDSLADSGGEIFALSDKFLKTVQKIDLKVQEYKNLRNQADIAYSRYYAEYKRRNIYK